jgi:hypothetical protein
MQVLSPHLAQRIIIIAAVGRAPFGRRQFLIIKSY